MILSETIRIAASQFPVSGNVDKNSRYIYTQIMLAAKNGANVILFPETALPGYGPKHIGQLNGNIWSQLNKHTRSICDLARSLGVWVILGTMRQGDKNLPMNCQLVISNSGEIVGTYDKRRLYDKEKGFYSSGVGNLVVEIGGYKCGFLICYDNCFPELYEEYRNEGVRLLFHSFFNAGNSHATSIRNLMPANLLVRAADNQMWIVASNSSSRYCPLSACIVRPDGSKVSTKKHVASLVFDDYPSTDLGWTYDNRTF